MYKSVAFTICAKNYLAQALTLKASFLKYNQNEDFFIYHSDAVDGAPLAEVVILDNTWIPQWFSDRTSFGHYLINGWDELIKYRKDGRYSIDNMPVERAIHPFTLHRKDSLFLNFSKAHPLDFEGDEYH